MTTCVYVDGVIACDTRMVYGNEIRSGEAIKIFQNKDKVVAVAGVYSLALKVKDWILDTDENHEYIPDFSGYEDCDHFTVMVVNKKSGKVHVYESLSLDPVPQNAPLAIGSGASYALASLKTQELMKQKADVKLAIKSAMELDIYTGGKVKTVSLDLKKGNKNKKKLKK